MKTNLILNSFFTLLLIAFSTSVFAQTTAFTYQGRLTDSTSGMTSGAYDFQFALYDVGGTLIGLSSTPTTNVTVTNGVFTVQLDFGANAFPGADRLLEIRVKKPVDTDYTTLTPRQQMTSSPYAIRSTNATNADNAANLDGIAANQFVRTDDARLSDTRVPTAGSDNYIQNNPAMQQPSSSFNISGNGIIGGNLIIKEGGGLMLNDNMLRLRGLTDGNHGLLYNSIVNGLEFRGFSGFSWRTGAIGATERMRLDSAGNLLLPNGNFGIGTNTAPTDRLQVVGNASITGTLTASSFNSEVFNASTQYNIAGNRVLSVLDNNLFAGVLTGSQNTTGSKNTFVGNSAGMSNTSGSNNSFFGADAGAGNASGSNNTLVGSGTRLIGTGASYSTAIGAGAIAQGNNTITLGRIEETVIIPGALKVINVPSGDRRNLQWDNTTGQLYQDTSSRRYKENIRPLVADFMQLLRAEPKTYIRPGTPNRWEIGFIAEEFDALGLKPLVEYDQENRPDGIRYDKITLYLTAIAAEQQEQIKQQQTKIENQEKQLQQQQALLDGMRKLLCQQNPQADICK